MSSLQLQKIKNQSNVSKSYIKTLLSVIKTPQKNKESLNFRKLKKCLYQK